MNSAFGIDHGEVSKSFTKLEPKLIRAMRKTPGMTSSDTMAERMQRNYLVGRANMGRSAGRPEQAGRWKEWTQASAKGHASAVKRTGTLP